MSGNKACTARSGSTVIYLDPRPNRGERTARLGKRAGCIPPDTPVGKALTGCRPGDERTVILANGEEFTVVVKEVLPPKRAVA